MGGINDCIQEITEDDISDVCIVNFMTDLECFFRLMYLSQTHILDGAKYV